MRRVLAIARQEVADRRDDDVYVVNLTTREVRHAARGLVPAERNWNGQDPLAPPGPGGRLFLAVEPWDDSPKGSQLVSLDPDTFATTFLTGPRRVP